MKFYRLLRCCSGIFFEKLKFIATKSTRTFEQARSNLAQTVIDGEMDEKERSRLYMMITVEQNSASSAWDMFDVHKSLLLGFASAIISFTVMIATSGNVASHENLVAN